MPLSPLSLGNNYRSSGSISNFQQIHHLKGCWSRERGDKKRSGDEVFAWLKRWKCFVMSCPSSFYIWYMIANNIWIYESTKEIRIQRKELVEDEQLLFLPWRRGIIWYNVVSHNLLTYLLHMYKRNTWNPLETILDIWIRSKKGSYISGRYLSTML